MRYFVVGSDGKRFGPADLQTLQDWANEGRLTESSKMVEEGTGSFVVASDVPGLVFLPRAPEPDRPVERVDNHLAKSIIVAIICCQPLGILAVIFSAQVDGLVMAGRTEEAKRKAKLANSFANWGIALFVLLILYTVFMAVGPLLGRGWV